MTPNLGVTREFAPAAAARPTANSLNSLQAPLYVAWLLGPKTKLFMAPVILRAWMTPNPSFIRGFTVAGVAGPATNSSACFALCGLASGSETKTVHGADDSEALDDF